MSWLGQKILGTDFAIAPEHKLLNGTIFTVTVVSATGIPSAFMKMSMVAGIVLFMTALSAFSYYLCRFKKQYKLATSLFTLSLICSTPLLWLLIDGANGRNTVMVGLVSAIIASTNNTKRIRYIIALFSLVILSLYIFHFNFPDFFTPYQNATEKYIDKSMGSIIAIVGTAVIISVLKRIYQREKENHLASEKIIKKKNEELKIAHNELLRQKEEVEKSLILAKEYAESKANFLSTMSHELRTPLNSIIGLTHYMASDNPKESQQKHLDAMGFSAQNLLTLINDILDFSKIEAGKLMLEEVPFKPEEVIRQVMIGFESAAHEKGLELKTTIQTEGNLIIGDPTRFTQVISNLTANAVKFTSQGSVEVSISKEHENNTHIDFKVSVKDTGIGIPDDKIDKIFDSFSQAEKATTRKFGGTGLGLTIVKHLLSLMDSEITVTSTPGSGSVFSFCLCLAKAQQQKPSISNSGTKDDLEGKFILLVDDNMMNIQVARLFLEQWGCKIIVAQNGIEAVEAVKNNTEFDAILMDLHMPQMTGYQATSEIRNYQKEHNLKRNTIIALTASVSQHIHDKVLSHDMDDYLAKPFVPDALYSSVVNATTYEEASPE